jgi:hypothetical protein
MTHSFKTAARNATLAASFAIAAGFGLAALPQAASAQAYTVRGEAAAHPGIVRAIREMEAIESQLSTAHEDFGGNKVQAMNQIHAAIHSLRRALFYRLNMDDAAIDRAIF